MISVGLVLFPLLCASAAWLAAGKRRLPGVLLVTGTVGHLIGTALLFLCPDFGSGFAADWLAPDSTSIIFLAITSLLFGAAALHTLRWIAAEQNAPETREHPDALLGSHIFTACLLAFLSTMSLVILARNFGLLWVAVEATTLVSAPLIMFHRSERSLEAMWKYLLICSVGIGLALFGTMLLAVAGKSAHAGLSFVRVAAVRDSLDPAWFKAAFIFILAGYGTKMGLAPFHTWLPDAHSEAPGTVSALLSGTLLNCSLLAILRFLDVAPDALRPFCSALLTALGLLSLGTAAFFIVRQSDFKRMLAYSSVEHMGLLALFFSAQAAGVGLCHLCGHSLIKMALFLVAGNWLLACGTRQIGRLGGLWNRMPRNAWLWLAGILMICGMPPSPLFVTEWLLLFQLPPLISGAVLLFLLIIFAGMSSAALRMLMGADGRDVPDSASAHAAEKLCSVPLLALLSAALLGLGLLAELFTMEYFQ